MRDPLRASHLAPILVLVLVAIGATGRRSAAGGPEAPDHFELRPEVEQAYGHARAARIGDGIKISGAMSMDGDGNLVAAGNLEQQMKSCHADLQEALAHYGCTIDDLVVENVNTTDMAGFIAVSGYRNTIYRKQFPTGTWLEVKGLALPGQSIEIDMEARSPR